MLLAIIDINKCHVNKSVASIVPHHKKCHVRMDEKQKKKKQNLRTKDKNKKNNGTKRKKMTYL